MRKSLRVIVSVAALAVLSASGGCTVKSWYTVVVPNEGQGMTLSGERSRMMVSVPEVVSQETVLGYTAGRRAAAAPGETLAEVRDSVLVSKTTIARALFDLAPQCMTRENKDSALLPDDCFRRPLNEFKLVEGEGHLVAGRIFEDRQSWYLVSVDARDGSFFLVVDADGRLRQERNLVWRDLNAWEHNVRDRGELPGATGPAVGEKLDYIDLPVALDTSRRVFDMEVSERRQPGQGNLNFDIVWAGPVQHIDGPRNRVILRDYSPSAPGYVVNELAVDYRPSVEMISLRGIGIALRPGDNGEVVFAVQPGSRPG
ncbi:MAG: hypothetical protein H8E45_04725 [Proteobacteria bacterium]|nr:hypothetical protein [Pseudomonadota bacterium]